LKFFELQYRSFLKHFFSPGGHSYQAPILQVDFATRGPCLHPAVLWVGDLLQASYWAQTSMEQENKCGERRLPLQPVYSFGAD